MRVAIIHYHFHRGGVRTVVENACSALSGGDYQFAVLSGEPLPEDGAAASGTLPQSGAPYRVLPELAYWRREWAPLVLERAKALAAEMLGGPPDVWHIHNHSLGKNATVPRLVTVLAAEGTPVLLQIHDFAEDGRPDNYRYLADVFGASDAEEIARGLYPQGGRVHYATLNGRDARFLTMAGALPERVHLLPNAVHLSLEADPVTPPPEHPLILYPTRAIRRKNIGEFLLYSRLGPPATYAVTMAPGNPVERPIYERWVALAHELNLPVEWEFGERSGMSFPALMIAARQIFTSSVGEGFGLAFLEPWLAGRPVAGRDLPEITGDFIQAGVRLPGLYSELRIPLGLQADKVRSTYQDALARAFQAYGRPLGRTALDAAWDEASPDGKVDFGKLDEAGQEHVIRIAEGLEFPSPEVTESVVAENRRVIMENYGPSAYRQRLEALYQRVAGESTTPIGQTPLSGSRLLECFLAPSRFTPLRGVR